MIRRFGFLLRTWGKVKSSSVPPSYDSPCCNVVCNDILTAGNVYLLDHNGLLASVSGSDQGVVALLENIHEFGGNTNLFKLV